MFLMGEVWREMALLIPEDDLCFGGSYICKAAMDNDAPLPLTAFCLPWGNMAGVSREQASWVKNRLAMPASETLQPRWSLAGPRCSYCRRPVVEQALL